MSETAAIEHAVMFLRSNIQEWCWSATPREISDTHIQVTIRAGQRRAAVLDLAVEGWFIAVAFARSGTKPAVRLQRRFDSRKDGWDRRFRNWAWPTLVSLVTKRAVQAR